MKDIRDDKTKVAAFLNPLMPEVQEYALTFIREIVGNYDIDGYVLDYCRFADVENDFSDYTRQRFETYIGKKVAHFPEDIFTWEVTDGQKVRKDGPLAKQWFAFRAGVIHDFIARTRKEIKTLQPDVQLEYWAASWYGHLYSNGQNWASQTYDATKEYPGIACLQQSGLRGAAGCFYERHLPRKDIWDERSRVDRVWPGTRQAHHQRRLQNVRQLIRP